MKIHPGSFVLGVGAAAIVPLFTRVLRPLAVELGAASLVAFEQGRRVLARGWETIEDIGAEARARSVELALASQNGHFDGEAEHPGNEVDGEASRDEAAASEARPGRRASAAGRRRTS